MFNPKNTWRAKLKRALTSILPVAKNRKGRCINCGACCRLPNRCPFLRFKKDGKSYCLIYKMRPFSCRKYPRTKDEWITRETCGYWFD